MLQNAIAPRISIRCVELLIWALTKATDGNPGKAQITTLTTEVQLKERSAFIEWRSRTHSCSSYPIVVTPFAGTNSPQRMHQKKAWSADSVSEVPKPGNNSMSLGPVQCDVEWSKQYVAGIYQSDKPIALVCISQSPERFGGSKVLDMNISDCWVIVLPSDQIFSFQVQQLAFHFETGYHIHKWKIRMFNRTMYSTELNGFSSRYRAYEKLGPPAGRTDGRIVRWRFPLMIDRLKFLSLFSSLSKSVVYDVNQEWEIAAGWI